MPTLKAIRACAYWLCLCRKLNINESDLDMLQKLWWKHHNDRGEFVETLRARQEGTER